MNTQQCSTVVGVFEDKTHANNAITELHQAGFNQAQIGILVQNSESVDSSSVTELESNAGSSALTGAVSGLGLGALAGFGVLLGVIPDVGPAIAQSNRQIRRLAGYVQAGRHAHALQRLILNELLANNLQHGHVLIGPFNAALPYAREREILRMRFEEGLPQTQIAQRVGLSQMHVSRLIRKSLAVMREELA